MVMLDKLLLIRVLADIIKFWHLLFIENIHLLWICDEWLQEMCFLRSNYLELQPILVAPHHLLEWSALCERISHLKDLLLHPHHLQHIKVFAKFLLPKLFYAMNKIVLSDQLLLCCGVPNSSSRTCCCSLS